jgi:hypothetical protein
MESEFHNLRGAAREKFPLPGVLDFRCDAKRIGLSSEKAVSLRQSEAPRVLPGWVPNVFRSLNEQDIEIFDITGMHFFIAPYSRSGAWPVRD